jgi:hypothetical protein
MRASKYCFRVQWVDIIRSAVVRSRQTWACYMFRNDNCPCCQCCNFPSRQNHLTHSVVVGKWQAWNSQIFCQVGVRLRNYEMYIFVSRILSLLLCIPWTRYSYRHLVLFSASSAFAVREPPLDAFELKGLVSSGIEIRPLTSEAINRTVELFWLYVLCSHYCLSHAIQKLFFKVTVGSCGMDSSGSEWAQFCITVNKVIKWRVCPAEQLLAYSKGLC